MLVITLGCRQWQNSDFSSEIKVRYGGVIEKVVNRSFRERGERTGEGQRREVPYPIYGQDTDFAPFHIHMVQSCIYTYLYNIFTYVHTHRYLCRCRYRQRYEYRQRSSQIQLEIQILRHINFGTQGSPKSESIPGPIYGALIISHKMFLGIHVPSRGRDRTGPFTQDHRIIGLELERLYFISAVWSLTLSKNY